MTQAQKKLLREVQSAVVLYLDGRHHGTIHALRKRGLIGVESVSYTDRGQIWIVYDASVKLTS